MRGGADRRSPRPHASPWSRVALGGGLVLAAVAALRAAAWWGSGAPVRLPAGDAPTGAGRRPTLLYVFHREDCRGQEELRERWAALHRAGVVRVLGIDLDGEAAGLPRPPFGFPVRIDSGGRAEHLVVRLGYDRTPVTLLVGTDGRLRLALGPPADTRFRRAAEAAVRAAAGLDP